MLNSFFDSICWLCLFTSSSVFRLLPGFCLHCSPQCSHWDCQWLLGYRCQYAFFISVLLPSHLSLAFLLRLLATSTLKLFPLGFCGPLSLAPLFRLSVSSGLLFLCPFTCVLSLHSSYSTHFLLTNIHDFFYLLHLDAPQIVNPNLFSPCRYICSLLLGISPESVLPGFHSRGFGMIGALLNASSSPVCLADTSNSPRLKSILFFNFLSHG